MNPVHPLRAHRLSHGWSQEDVAERLQRLGEETGTRGLATSGTTVGRWERGECRPRPPYPRLLCILFEASAMELGLASSPYTPPSDTLDDMERRRILRLLAGALAAPIVVGGRVKAGARAEAERLVRALSRPSGADEAVAVTVESGIATARRFDDTLGPRAAVEAALVQRQILRTLLRGGPRQAIRAKLTVAAGELEQFLGWLAHDMNDERTSRRYLDEALRIAHDAGADNLGAYVLGHRSRFEVTAGRPQQAIAFAEAARTWADAKGSPATRSWLAVAEARALADLGDRNGAERALDRARSTFGRSKAADEPPWMYFYEGAELDAMAGFVYLSLGLAQPARRTIEQALTTSDPSRVRDRACYLGRLGLTYVLDAEPDEACRLAGAALTIATTTRSDGGVQRVRELRAQLKPWETEPMVRDLDDQLAAASAWSRPVLV